MLLEKQFFQKIINAQNLLNLDLMKRIEIKNKLKLFIMTYHPYLHMIDLFSFVNDVIDELRNFTPASDLNDIYFQDFDFISENVLKLFTEWSTGITMAMILQDLLVQIRTNKKKQFVKPDETQQQKIEGEILGIILYTSPNLPGNPRTNAAAITIKQEQCEELVTAVLHGALLPFLNTFISEKRHISFANIRFLNDCLIPNQLCIIDLMQLRDDIAFIIQKTQTTRIQNLNEGDTPEAILLKVEKPIQEGFVLSDGSELTIDFQLSQEQIGFRKLLHFGDILIIYKAEVIKNEVSNRLSLVFGPCTVFFRVPFIQFSTTSQISQKSLSQKSSGLSFRNSTACKFVRGTVESIENNHDSDIWYETIINIFDMDNRSFNISVQISEIKFETTKILASIRPNHFIWIFGAIEVSSKNSQILKLNQESTIFNTSLLYSPIASSFVTPQSLSVLNYYCTFVARAIIINASFKLVDVHKLCGNAISNGYCPICKCYTSKKEKEFILQLEIDDGSCDPITVYGVGSKFPFFGISKRNFQKRDIQQLLGKEHIFLLSKGNGYEFLTFDDSPIWRVDQCLDLVGDIEREVDHLIKWHQKLDSKA